MTTPEQVITKVLRKYTKDLYGNFLLRKPGGYEYETAHYMYARHVPKPLNKPYDAVVGSAGEPKVFVAFVKTPPGKQYIWLDLLRVARACTASSAKFEQARGKLWVVSLSIVASGHKQGGVPYVTKSVGVPAFSLFENIGVFPTDRHRSVEFSAALSLLEDSKNEVSLQKKISVETLMAVPGAVVVSLGDPFPKVATPNPNPFPSKFEAEVEIETTHPKSQFVYYKPNGGGTFASRSTVKNDTHTGDTPGLQDIYTAETVVYNRPTQRPRIPHF